MRRTIALAAHDRRLVLQILAANLPPATKVWVFGSRAGDHARRYSDLDLAIDAGRPLTLDETGGLAEAFSDSELPFRVDIIDWRTVDPSFRKIIAKGRRPLLEVTAA